MGGDVVRIDSIKFEDALLEGMVEGDVDVGDAVGGEVSLIVDDVDATAEVDIVFTMVVFFVSSPAT